MYYYMKKDVGLPSAEKRMKTREIFSLQNSLSVTETNKTLGRARDLRTNGALLNKLTE